MALLLFVALSLAALPPSCIRPPAPTSVPETLSFDDWADKFGKLYSSAQERKLAMVAFEANVKLIEAHNAKDSTYRMGVNAYSDMTSDAFAKTMLKPLTRHRPVGHEVWLPVANAVNGSVDWRTKGAVTAVKNQGRCGSCWSFSTTGAIEGAYAIATGALRNLSEQQLCDCSVPEGDHGCGGGLMDHGFQYVLDNHGLDSEEDYSYLSGGGQDQTCWVNATRRVVATIDSFSDVPPKSEEQLAAAVLLQPVSVAIEADQPGFQHYKSGVYDGQGCGTHLDHGVLVVGMTAEYWVVKNSWGGDWGESGYIRLAKGVNATAGAICGITLSASYPVKQKGSPLPIPAPTPNSTRPGPPKPGPVCPGCKSGAQDPCRQLGMHCFCAPPFFKSYVCRHDKKCCKNVTVTQEFEEDDQGSCSTSV
jgi:KDEL-tailed cysteine endopeptidase